MDYFVIAYCTGLIIGLMSLYGLRNTSLKEGLALFGPVVAFGIIVQRIASFSIFVFIVIAIIKAKWYSPFLNLVIAIILSIIIGRILLLLKLNPSPTEMPRIGILFYSILASVSFISLLSYYFV